MHLDIGHMVVSSVVHGLIYGVIFKFTRHLTAWQTLAVAVIGVGVVWVGSQAFKGRRCR